MPQTALISRYLTTCARNFSSRSSTRVSSSTSTVSGVPKRCHPSSKSTRTPFGNRTPPESRSSVQRSRGEGAAERGRVLTAAAGVLVFLLVLPFPPFFLALAALDVRGFFVFPVVDTTALCLMAVGAGVAVGAGAFVVELLLIAGKRALSGVSVASGFGGGARTAVCLICPNATGWRNEWAVLEISCPKVVEHT